MRLIEHLYQWIFRLNSSDKFDIIPFERNELCYCNSGLKYKKCHALKYESHNKIACRLISKKTKIVKIKILKIKNLKIDTNLRWVDIGVGSTGMID